MRGAGEGTERFDLTFTRLWLVLVLGLFVVAGLDAVRFGWAPLPGWTVGPGFGPLALASVPIGWSAWHNTLRAELPGYAEFARHTRYRLLPGIW